MNQCILLERLERSFRITNSALRWLSSYVTDRNQCFRRGAVTWLSTTLECGVPFNLAICSQLVSSRWTSPANDWLKRQWHHPDLSAKWCHGVLSTRLVIPSSDVFPTLLLGWAATDRYTQRWHTDLLWFVVRLCCRSEQTHMEVLRHHFWSATSTCFFMLTKDTPSHWPRLFHAASQFYVNCAEYVAGDVVSSGAARLL